MGLLMRALRGRVCAVEVLLTLEQELARGVRHG